MEQFVKVLGIEQIRGLHVVVLDHIQEQDVKHHYLIHVMDYV